MASKKLFSLKKFELIESIFWNCIFMIPDPYMLRHTFNIFTCFDTFSKIFIAPDNSKMPKGNLILLTLNL